MLKLFKTISFIMIPSTFLFFGIRYFDAEKEYQYLFLLPFLASISTYYLLKSYWNKHINSKSYELFKNTKIKIPSLKRALLLFYAIQFFWITYWASNWLILIVLFLVIMYYECHYSIYPENIMVSHEEYVNKTGKINIKNDACIHEQMMLIQSAPTFFSKIKRIHFDLYAVTPTSKTNLLFRPFRCLWLLIFFIGITFNFEQYTFPTPLSHFSTLQYNKGSRFPKLEEVMLFNNVQFQIASGYYSWPINLIVKTPIQTYYFTNATSKLDRYRGRSGYADVWVYSEGGRYFLVQFNEIREQNAIKIDYNETLTHWLSVYKNRNHNFEFYQNFALFICLIGFFLSLISDYIYYFYLRKIYYGPNNA